MESINDIEKEIKGKEVDITCNIIWSNNSKTISVLEESIINLKKKRRVRKKIRKS